MTCLVRCQSHLLLYPPNAPFPPLITIMVDRITTYIYIKKVHIQMFIYLLCKSQDQKKNSFNHCIRSNHCIFTYDCNFLPGKDVIRWHPNFFRRFNQLAGQQSWPAHLLLASSSDCAVKPPQPTSIRNSQAFQAFHPSSLHLWTRSWYLVTFLSEASSHTSSHGTVSSIIMILLPSSDPITTSGLGDV